MRAIHTNLEKTLHDRMYMAIQQVSVGSTYGKAQVFVRVAIEKLVEKVEANDAKVLRELHTEFEKIRKA